MGRSFEGIWWALLACASLTCKVSEDDTATHAQKSAEEQSQPAAAAGTSSETGPGVPADFAGKIRDSIVTDAEQALRVAGSDAKTLARNPPAQNALDRGFGRPRANKKALPGAAQ